MCSPPSSPGPDRAEGWPRALGRASCTSMECSVHGCPPLSCEFIKGQHTVLIAPHPQGSAPKMVFNRKVNHFVSFSPSRVCYRKAASFHLTVSKLQFLQPSCEPVPKGPNPSKNLSPRASAGGTTLTIGLPHLSRMPWVGSAMSAHGLG